MDGWMHTHTQMHLLHFMCMFHERPDPIRSDPIPHTPACFDPQRPAAVAAVDQASGFLFILFLGGGEKEREKKQAKQFTFDDGAVVFVCSAFLLLFAGPPSPSLSLSPAAMAKSSSALTDKSASKKKKRKDGEESASRTAAIEAVSRMPL